MPDRYPLNSPVCLGRTLLLWCLMAGTGMVMGQEVITKTIHLDAGHKRAMQALKEHGVLWYEQHIPNLDNETVPFYIAAIEIPHHRDVNVRVSQLFFSNTQVDIPVATSGPVTVNPEWTVGRGRNNQMVRVSFLPGQWVNANKFQLLDSIRLEIILSENVFVRNNPPPTKPESLLKSLASYKIATSGSGVYKITSADLQAMGINPANVIPGQIRLLGTLPGPLPELNKEVRTDDLEEVAFEFFGGANGRWNQDDYLLFYAPGPHRWDLNSDNTMSQKTNIYDDSKYFFLQIGAPSKNISLAGQPGTADFETSRYDYIHRFEVDQSNILRDIAHSGAGQLWFGEKFQYGARSKDYTSTFNLNNLIPGDTGTVRIGFASRSALNTSLHLKSDGQQFTIQFGRTNIGYAEAIVASYVQRSFNFIQAGDKWNVSIDYPTVGGESSGWLDYIEVNASRQLIKTNAGMPFRLINPPVTSNIQYHIIGITSNDIIYDVTDMFNVRRYQPVIAGNSGSFIAPFSQSKEFYCFSPQQVQSITPIGKIDPQNIHGLETPDMVVVYHKDFENEALEFSNYRASKSNMVVHAIDIEKIKNEFSGGAQDPTGIRDMARMFYHRNPDKFRYLLLYGDGSYDYKDLTLVTKLNTTNSNFIPVYEYPRQPLDPVRALPSDDYYGFMDEEEGDILVGLIDVYVGRFPVKNRSEAATINNKIKHYENNKETFGDWRNNLMLLADDWDNPHADNFVVQSEKLADKANIYDPNLNISKIFMDLYKQEVSVGGQRYPDANKDMIDQFHSGVLIANYIGHGGPDGLAQEKIIERSTLNSLQNSHKLPLFITGTCSFSTYDDPAITSVGKLCLIRPNGGMIALMTTTRSIYINSNETIINRMFENIYKKTDGKYLSIGEMMAFTKNQTASFDRMAFALLGDPSMYLAFPEHTVTIETLNGKDFDAPNRDTIRALEKVKLTGSVRDFQNQLVTDFNGTLTLTVFDKPNSLFTRGNDGNGANTEVSTQKSTLFKGKASVTNGQYSIEFITPKDINYAIGYGKMSLYATNETTDANGYADDIYIGGSSLNGINDDTPPEIQLFLNDIGFKSGSEVGTNPLLIAKLKDDTGINISGSSIGHDIVSQFNSLSSSEKVLNDFYVADKDSYNTGEVRYQLEALAPGEYTLSLRAWDLSNNKGEAQIEFIVSDSEENAIDHVLNYPNPFTTATSFMFEYNGQNNSVEAHISIYTVSGKLVKTIIEPISPVGKRYKSSIWDGRDDFGSQLAKGVYVYKIKVINPTNTANRVVHSDFQKLVLLK